MNQRDLWYVVEYYEPDNDLFMKLNAFATSEQAEKFATTFAESNLDYTSKRVRIKDTLHNEVVFDKVCLSRSALPNEEAKIFYSADGKNTFRIAFEWKSIH